MQKQVLTKKIKKRFGSDIRNLTFCIWGLSFKPGTDDMREAPAIVLINDLIASEARIKAYDPVAMNQARQEFPQYYFHEKKLELFDNPYDALNGCDAMVLVTEWKTFRQPAFKDMAARMKQAVIFDGRNLYDPEIIKEEGFEYHGIGREPFS